MSGEELSSTDLHLACNDTLLVGQVAEMSQIDPSDTEYSHRVHPRKLQVKLLYSCKPQTRSSVTTDKSIYVIASLNMVTSCHGQLSYHFESTLFSYEPWC